MRALRLVHLGLMLIPIIKRLTSAALADKNSLFYTYQEMIRLRKEHP